MYFPFFLALAYVLGSIPFGLVLSRWRKRMDITQVGSGNIGATNVLRQAGPALVIAVLVWLRHKANLRRLAEGAEPRIF